LTEEECLKISQATTKLDWNLIDNRYLPKPFPPNLRSSGKVIKDICNIYMNLKNFDASKIKPKLLEFMNECSSNTKAKISVVDLISTLESSINWHEIMIPDYGVCILYRVKLPLLLQPEFEKLKMLENTVEFGNHIKSIVNDNELVHEPIELDDETKYHTDIVMITDDNYVYPDDAANNKWSGKIYVSHYSFKIVISLRGTGLIDEPITVDDIQTHDIHKLGENKESFISKKLNVTSQTTDEFLSKLSTETVSTLQSLDVINNVAITDWERHPHIDVNDNKQIELVVGNGTYSNPITVEINELLVGPSVMNYWDDETAMVNNVIPLPRNAIGLKGGENVTGLKVIDKNTMVQYPTNSQPNYTVRAYAGLSAMSELFGSKLVLRTVEHNPQTDALLFVKTYFIENAINSLPQLNVNYDDVISWLKERPDACKIANEVDKILSEGLDINGLDKVNVHLKLESRLKDVMLNAIDEIGMPTTIEQQRVRLIVWQRKGITAIFASLFLKVKEHLKRCLRNQITYADGYTPAQLSAIANQISATDIVFVEDDLKKQDRQTDMTLIKTEMAIYKLLNANPGVIDIWESVHHKWRARGLGYTFNGDGSRLTGQATTAIGNAIINMLVKMRLVNTLGPSLKKMFVLGDDNALLSTQYVTEEQVSLQSARHWNMQSEPVISRKAATFLRMMIYKNSNNTVEIGPDIIRLRRKFEVLNGVHEATNDNVTMRSMSYCCMLGSLNCVKSLVIKKNWPIQPTMWYEYHSCVEATAYKYKCSVQDVENNLNILIRMMDQNITYKYSKLMFVSKMS